MLYFCLITDYFRHAAVLRATPLTRSELQHAMPFFFFFFFFRPPAYAAFYVDARHASSSMLTRRHALPWRDVDETMTTMSHICRLMFCRDIERYLRCAPERALCHASALCRYAERSMRAEAPHIRSRCARFYTAR